MNNNYKYLAWSGTVALIMLTIFLGVNAIQLSNTATTTNTVSFSGEGKVTAKPDIAVISATILTQAADSKTAQDQNSKKSKAVTDFLHSQGIADKNIKTTGYNIYPQYNSKPCLVSGSGMMYPCVQQQQISGYQVSENFEIKVRDLNKIGTILAGLTAAGANQVNNLGLQIENPEALKSQARQLAIDAAKKKAAELENQVGISLGHIVNFSENTGGYPQPLMYEVAKDGVGGGGTTPDISPGQNDIVVNVTITYQIK